MQSKLSEYEIKEKLKSMLFNVNNILKNTTENTVSLSILQQFDETINILLNDLTSK